MALQAAPATQIPNPQLQPAVAVLNNLRRRCLNQSMPPTFLVGGESLHELVGRLGVALPKDGKFLVGGKSLLGIALP